MNNDMDCFFSPTPFNAKTNNKQQPKKQDKQTNNLIQFCLSSGLTLMWADTHANPPSYDPNSIILQASLSESS